VDKGRLVLLPDEVQFNTHTFRLLNGYVWADVSLASISGGDTPHRLQHPCDDAAVDV